MPRSRRRRVSKRSPSRSRHLRSGKRTANDVRDLLTNPTHGYGIVLLPAELVSALIQKFEQNLAKMRSERGKPLTIAELDEQFQTYFNLLVGTGSCTRGEDVVPSVPKETWLKAQQVAIELLARGAPT